MSPVESRRPFRRIPSQDALYWVMLGGVVVAVLAVYFPVRHHPFFYPDDGVYLVDNQHVQAGLSWSTFVWAFRSYITNWHPLTWLSHAFDYQLFGLNPTGHHLMNVVFHALNVCLLFWVLRRATGFAGRSLMVAALFALHPINVEPVVWVAERKTLLSTVFFLLALGAYRWYVQQPSEKRYWTVAILFVLGLLAKPQIVAFPFLLLLWDYWPLGRMFSPGGKSIVGTNSVPGFEPRKFWWLVKEKIPLFFFAAADALMTINAQGVMNVDQWHVPLSVRIENAIVCYVRYIGEALWPASLAPYYPHPGHLLPWLQVLGALALLAAITALVAFNWQERYLTVGWFWFLGIMVPMIGLIQVGRQAMADRYAYQPFLGLFLMLCWGIAEWSQRKHIPVIALRAASVAILLSLVLATRRQVNFWQNDMTIWSHTLEVTPNSVAAEYHIGLELLKTGDTAGAMKHFFAGHMYDPDDPYTNLQLALYEHKAGNLSAALESYKQVLAQMQEPDLIRLTWVNMAHIYQQEGNSEKAAECWRGAKQAEEKAARAPQR